MTDITKKNPQGNYITKTSVHTQPNRRILKDACIIAMKVIRSRVAVVGKPSFVLICFQFLPIPQRLSIVRRFFGGLPTIVLGRTGQALRGGASICSLLCNVFFFLPFLFFGSHKKNKGITKTV